MHKNLRKVFLLLGSILLLGQPVVAMDQSMYADEVIHPTMFHGYKNTYVEQPHRFKSSVLSGVAQHCVSLADQASPEVAALYHNLGDKFKKASAGDFGDLEAEGNQVFKQIKKSIQIL